MRFDGSVCECVREEVSGKIQWKSENRDRIELEFLSLEPIGEDSATFKEKPGVRQPVNQQSAGTPVSLDIRF